jgi:hypothetical protein
MALKRINKELTDLGRYVQSLSLTATHRVEVGCLSANKRGHCKFINNLIYDSTSTPSTWTSG